LPRRGLAAAAAVATVVGASGGGYWALALPSPLLLPPVMGKPTEGTKSWIRYMTH
ncbi:hypothetical protein Taro_045853, partial [Colocasia esculenta]|nr:hypothetical protein [Colocasia esculenta]